MSLPAHPPQPEELHPAASFRLDVLRLMLIAQVMLGHYAMIAYPRFPDLDFARPADLFVAIYRLLTRFGGEAAFVFVCISGFLLVPRLLASGLGQAGSAPIGSFLLARVRRIYPTLIAAIALTALCDGIALGWLGAEQFYRHAPSYDAVAALNLHSALGNLLSLQPTFSGAFGSNGPLWTLGYIVQFYCAGSLLAAFLRQGAGFAAASAIALLAAGLVWNPEWALLLLCWLGCGAMRWFAARSRGEAVGLALGGLALFILANRLPDPVSVIPAGLAAAAWLSALQVRSPSPAGLRVTGLVARPSSASFPLYAFHFPLAMLMLAAMGGSLEPDGLALRLIWPVLAAIPALIFALSWQGLLDRTGRKGRV